MCHLKQDHENNQMIITNLADEHEQKHMFRFDHLRFITFLSLSKIHAESRICFLARNMKARNPKKSNLSVILMKHDKSFEDSRRVDQDWKNGSVADALHLDKWQILRINLGKYEELQQSLS